MFLLSYWNYCQLQIWQHEDVPFLINPILPSCALCSKSDRASSMLIGPRWYEYGKVSRAWNSVALLVWVCRLNMSCELQLNLMTPTKLWSTPISSREVMCKVSSLNLWYKLLILTVLSRTKTKSIPPISDSFKMKFTSYVKYTCKTSCLINVALASIITILYMCVETNQ